MINLEFLLETLQSFSSCSNYNIRFFGFFTQILFL